MGKLSFMGQILKKDETIVKYLHPVTFRKTNTFMSFWDKSLKRIGKLLNVFFKEITFSKINKFTNEPNWVLVDHL